MHAHAACYTHARGGYPVHGVTQPVEARECTAHICFTLSWPMCSGCSLLSCTQRRRVTLSVTKDDGERYRMHNTWSSDATRNANSLPSSCGLWMPVRPNVVLLAPDPSTIVSPARQEGEIGHYSSGVRKRCVAECEVPQFISGHSLRDVQVVVVVVAGQRVPLLTLRRETVNSTSASFLSANEQSKLIKLHPTPEKKMRSRRTPFPRAGSRYLYS